MSWNRNLLVASGSALVIVSLVVACGSSDDGSQFGKDDGDSGPGSFTDGPFGDSSFDSGDLYANDPLAKWCGVDGGAPAAPPVTGTEDCPSDKNKPGCGCSTLGQTAACWTGLRANRGLGICKDGTTKCINKDEVTYVWGPCEGEVLPTQGAKGAQACSCFSQGQWNIANLSPCFFTSDNTNYTAFSTNGSTDPVSGCGAGDPPSIPTSPPAAIWSHDTLKVDCAGHFKLCFTIKAGDAKNPSPSDCTVGKVCTEADYPTENVEMPLPDLPGWLGADTACATKWNNTDPNVSAGYGEMSVKGLSVRCDEIDDGSGNEFVFNRVQYCPTMCRTNPSDPTCQACGNSGSGTF